MRLRNSLTSKASKTPRSTNSACGEQLAWPVVMRPDCAESQ